MHTASAATAVAEPAARKPGRPSFNQQLYKFDTPQIGVPVLVPGLQYKFCMDVLCIDEDGSAEPVQVYVCGSNSVVPMISAIVNMPLSDIILPDE